MPQTIIDLLNNGGQANNADKFRQGNIIHLPAEGELIITGDLHGHRRNFERIVAFADLANNTSRHIILQEIIHGGPEDSLGGCLSYKLLFEIVRYKLEFPDRVHILMGNHDTACIDDSEVMKNGKEMNRSMSLALKREFLQDSTRIEQAIRDFLFSQPLALRTENRIWASHSLPAGRFIDQFDQQIFERPLTIDDVTKPGSAYLLTWGRRHPQPVLDKLAALFDIDTFILGHQQQEQGWSKAGDNLIIISSEHNHGCLLPIDLEEPCTTDELAESIVPLASIS